MVVEKFLDGRVVLHCGDCLEVMASLSEGSVDSVVCDPPYHLTSIVKRLGKEGAAPVKTYTTGAYGGGFKEANGGTGAAFARMSRGFMGKQWDGGDIAFRPETWAAVLRVLKPGGHVLAFSGTRTYHRMACAIEDAGFEIRDQIAWMYGSGFPKSHDVSKGIDKRLGAEREVVGTIKKTPSAGGANTNEGWVRPWAEGKTTMDITAPATDLAAQWSGWGTALKPALEPICLARKPLIGTVADNVLEHGTGAINIDGCRISANDKTPFPVGANSADGSIKTGLHNKPRTDDTNKNGRWPANVIHDGSDEVVEAFPISTSVGHVPANGKGNPFGGVNDKPRYESHTDSGSAARFFYTAKAGGDDRLGSRHPTVKPLDLMRWLCRLVTPPGGTVLDPFAGTGTTGEAAFWEGFNAILIEREPEYQADIRRRMSLVLGGGNERRYASIKAKGLTEGAGPLFGGLT
jgi:DNA modification methylase